MAHEGSVPLYWRLKKHKYNLIGTECKTCKNLFYPPRNICPICRRKGKIEEFKFSGDGEVLSYTIIRVPPTGFEQYAPYAVGIIKLKEGPTIAGQIVGDINKVEIGKKVSSVFRRIFEDGDEGLIHYGMKFRLLE